MTFDEGYHRPDHPDDIPLAWLLAAWAFVAACVIVAILLVWL